MLKKMMMMMAFARWRSLWGEGSTIHSLPALCFACFFNFYFLFKWISARTLQFHSSGQDQSVHSGSAS